MNYIMLTERRGEDKVVINLDYVDLFYVDEDGVTCVDFCDGTCITVKESVSDIYNLI
ncbi:MAG: hypothetical protein IKC83_01910 [Clostridia bacterium]|nr:hypothetical protein [Clostridia bacterium]